MCLEHLKVNELERGGGRFCMGEWQVTTFFIISIIVPYTIHELFLVMHKCIE